MKMSIKISQAYSVTSFYITCNRILTFVFTIRKEFFYENIIF